MYDPATGRTEEGAARLVAHQLRDFGWTPEIDLVAPGRPNVIAVVDGGRPGPTLMFEGHTDVVTEGDRLDRRPVRRRDRRRPALRTGLGRHEGRAGGDAVRHPRRAPTGPVPGPHRARRAGRRGGHDARAPSTSSPRGRTTGVDGAICCEPEGGEICHVAKGALRLRLDFTGAMAHGAMPFQGRNPNPRAGRPPRRARRAGADRAGPHRRPPPPRARVDSRRRCCGPASRCR